MAGFERRGFVSSAEVHIRQMRAGDAAQLARVHAQAWQETYAGMLSTEFFAAATPESRLPMWTRLAGDPEPMSRHWVADDGGTVVGFAGVRLTSGSVREHELWGLYLLQSHQKQGLGKALIRAALGDRPASLWVAAENANAIGFYEREGFALDGTREVVADWENLVELRMVR